MQPWENFNQNLQYDRIDQKSIESKQSIYTQKLD